MGGLSYPYRSHIQIWGQTIKNCAVYRHFYGCFMKHAVTFLWIHCPKSIWLLLDLCLSSNQTFKSKKFIHLTICGKKIYSLSLSNKKLWPSLLKRCKCPQLAKKGGHIYERVQMAWLSALHFLTKIDHTSYHHLFTSWLTSDMDII